MGDTCYSNELNHTDGKTHGQPNRQARGCHTASPLPWCGGSSGAVRHVHIGQVIGCGTCTQPKCPQPTLQLATAVLPPSAPALWPVDDASLLGGPRRGAARVGAGARARPGPNTRRVRHRLRPPWPSTAGRAAPRGPVDRASDKQNLCLGTVTDDGGTTGRRRVQWNGSGPFVQRSTVRTNASSGGSLFVARMAPELLGTPSFFTDFVDLFRSSGGPFPRHSGT